MANVVFSESDAARIIRAVKAIEGLQLGGTKQRSQRGDIRPVQLQDDLRNDNHVEATILLSQHEEDPEADDATFELNTTSSDTITVYPWAIPADKQISAGRQIWACWWDGKWRSVVIEDCLDEREEPEEE